jgi:hypothetical protein
MQNDERQTTLTRPRVLRISSRHQDVPMRFAQPGTVALMIAGAEGADMLNRIADAVEREDLEEVERLHAETKQAFARAILSSDPAKVAQEHERTHVAFVHGRRRVVVGMFTPSGIPIAHSLALLDGDQVDPESFAIAVSRLAGTDDEVHALAVARVPQLTQLERNVLVLAPRGLSGGVELGFWAEAFVARVAADLGQRAVEWAADELGIADQINAARDIIGQVEHAAQDVVGAAFDAADGVIHGLAEAAGIDGVIQAGEDVVHAVGEVVDAVDHAVDNVAHAAADVAADAAGAVVNAAADAADAVGHAVVDAADAVGHAVADAADAVGDAVGAAVDWVADHIFGSSSLEFQQQFEEAAMAQKTFQNAFQRQIEAGTLSLETIKPAASLAELVSLRSQIVRQTAPRVRAVSLLKRG